MPSILYMMNNIFPIWSVSEGLYFGEYADDSVFCK